jgi:hypothetical protein
MDNRRVIKPQQRRRAVKHLNRLLSEFIRVNESDPEPLCPNWEHAFAILNMPSQYLKDMRRILRHGTFTKSERRTWTNDIDWRESRLKKSQATALKKQPARIEEQLTRLKAVIQKVESGGVAFKDARAVVSLSRQHCPRRRLRIVGIQKNAETRERRRRQAAG